MYLVTSLLVLTLVRPGGEKLTRLGVRSWQYKKEGLNLVLILKYYLLTSTTHSAELTGE